MTNIDFERMAEGIKTEGDASALSRVILCRCDDKESVEVGKRIGINLYQGRYIDKLLRDSEGGSLLRNPR